MHQAFTFGRQTEPRHPIYLQLSVSPSGHPLHSLQCLIFVLQLCSLKQNNTHKASNIWWVLLHNLYLL